MATKYDVSALKNQIEINLKSIASFEEAITRLQNENKELEFILRTQEKENQNSGE